LARATMLLVHSALEHDLRTLNGAAAAIARLASTRRSPKASSRNEPQGPRRGTGGRH
jgi:hypothetical protein